MPSPRPYVLSETNWKVVKETDYQLAVLPWGATEAHNYHLPYGTDNDFKQMIRELSTLYPEVFVCSLNLFHAVDWRAFFTEKPDHAGEMETSMMMQLRPDWVSPLAEAGDGKAKVYRFQAFKEGWATSQRQWSKVTESTGVGSPYLATPEKGEAWIAAVTKKVSEFLIELADCDLDDLYE